MPKQIGQEQLVFGDLKSIYKKQVTGSYKEIGKQYRHLQEIEEQLFVGFTSYILAKAGYNDTTLYNAPIGDDEVLEVETTITPDWVDQIRDFMGVKEEENILEQLGGAEKIYANFPRYLTWSHCYEQALTKEKLKVIFTQEAEFNRDINSLFDLSNPNWKVLRGIDQTRKNFVLINPSIKVDRKIPKLRDSLLAENISLITVQELANQFITKSQKKKVLDDWITIRNMVLEEFAIKEPVVADAIDPRQLSLEDLIKRPESNRLEFKSSITYDIKLSDYSKEREDDIVKALSAFMNSEGGVLIIGVDDNHNILGLEKDLQNTPKHNEDGLTLRLTDIVSSHLGNLHHEYLKTSFREIDGKLVGRVDVSRSGSPAYLKDSKGRTQFYIRVNNSSRPLGLVETVEYIKQHWG